MFTNLNWEFSRQMSSRIDSNTRYDRDQSINYFLKFIQNRYQGSSRILVYQHQAVNVNQEPLLSPSEFVALIKH